MKTFKLFLLISMYVFNPCYSQTDQGEFPVLTGPYLGQKPPGKMPELFAPGIIAGKGHTHGSPVISADNNIIYWDESETGKGALHHKIYYSRRVNNKWTKPEAVPFTMEWAGDSPVLSPDGKKLFFNSRRPTENNPSTKMERIWYVDILSETSWSKPKPLPETINGEPLHWQISFDKKQNLYFGSERKGSLGRDDIFVARYENNSFSEPQNMGNKINSEMHESTPFMQLDGDYILFTRIINRKDCILIVFKNNKGGWGNTVNITDQYPQIFGTCPRVTPDGKYIFFNRYENRTANVYWLDAGIINELKKE